MFKLLRAVTTFSSGKRGAKIVLGLWLVVVLALTLLAPSSKQYAVNSNATDLPSYVPSEQAREVMETHYPSDQGLTALLVFHDQTSLTDAEKDQIATLSRWLVEEKPAGVADAPPLYKMPAVAWNSFLSEDHTTLMLPVQLQKGLDSHGVHDAVDLIGEHAKEVASSPLQVAITGPAGISSDAINVFKNADVVLMISTVVLILLLLIVLYRSPLLALMPLVIAGLVYEVADRLLGLGGKNGWFVVESQSLSIMMILLFAVLTDYCLFVFSRYKEELRTTSSQWEAMQKAMTHVGEPIFFSASIILVSVLTLSVAHFKPYQHFAPVFGVALFVILFGGLTLIPALFALLGRKAFWPFVPKLDAPVSEKKGLWNRMGRLVTAKPRSLVTILSLVLIAASLFIGNISYSFNLLKSFPESSSSRAGFEMLEQHFPKGSLAPVSVALEFSQPQSTNDQLITSLRKVEDSLSQVPGVQSLSPKIETTLPAGVLASDKQALKLQLVLADDPYDPAAMTTLQTLRQRANAMLQDAGFDPSQVSMHFAGQTPIQVDTRDVNQRDTTLVVVLVTLLITILLFFQSRSLIAPLYMIATILLTYGTSLGISWMVFHNLLGYEAISYRIPLYTFVFLVALGIDYNIMLLSRVREEAQHLELKQAVQRAVSLTGKTISSAGLILVATFAVLMTQPLQELFMFGFVVAFGVLIDTFVVRGLLMPSLMVLLGRWNWWPKKKATVEKGDTIHV